MSEGRHNGAGSEARSRLTLGAIHHALRDELGDTGWARVAIRFEQRSAVTESAEVASKDPELFVVRTFQAHLDFNDGELERAAMVSGGMSQQPNMSVRIVRRPHGEYVYTVDGVRFGLLSTAPDLFDFRRFEAKLDAVTVADATVEQVQRNGDSALVLDTDVDVESFRSLLAAFSSDSGDESLDLRSYSVTVTASDELSLDYWWSLIGSEYEDNAEYRNSVACHVEISLGLLTDSEAVLPTDVDVELPALNHIDDVWELARSRKER